MLPTYIIRSFFERLLKRRLFCIVSSLIDPAPAFFIKSFVLCAYVEIFATFAPKMMYIEILRQKRLILAFMQQKCSVFKLNRYSDLLRTAWQTSWTSHILLFKKILTNKKNSHKLKKSSQAACQLATHCNALCQPALTYPGAC